MAAQLFSWPRRRRKPVQLEKCVELVPFGAADKCAAGAAAVSFGRATGVEAVLGSPLEEVCVRVCVCVCVCVRVYVSMLYICGCHVSAPTSTLLYPTTHGTRHTASSLTYRYRNSHDRTGPPSGNSNIIGDGGNAKERDMRAYNPSFPSPSPSSYSTSSSKGEKGVRGREKGYAFV